MRECQAAGYKHQNEKGMVGRARIEHAKHVGEFLEAVAKLGLLGTRDVLFPLPTLLAEGITDELLYWCHILRIYPANAIMGGIMFNNTDL